MREQRLPEAWLHVKWRGSITVTPGPQRWGRVEQSFIQALEQPADQRNRWL